MKIQLLGLYALALCLLACGQNLASGQAQADQDLAQVVIPHRDKKVPKLLSRAITWPARSEARTKAIEELLAMDRDKLLSALAYQMTDREYNNCCLAFIRMYLPDRRLTPHLLRVVQEAEGQTLMEAVRAAQAIPDPRLLAPIFDHALESAYAEMAFYSDDHGRQVIRKPLFGEAAKAIHIITGGAVGLKEVPDEEKLRSIKQEKLPQWRQWWQENKANWPAAPPLPEKPKEPASPGKKAPEKGASEGNQPPAKTDPPQEPPPPAPAGRRGAAIRSWSHGLSLHAANAHTYFGSTGRRASLTPPKADLGSSRQFH